MTSAAHASSPGGARLVSNTTNPSNMPSLDALADALRMPRAIAGQLVVDDYRVDRIIGKGGSAIVAAATHLHTKECVALKILRADAALHPTAVERFVREACVAMRLRSEGVARVLDAGITARGVPFIAMELLEGEDLGSVLRHTGALAVSDAVDSILQACEALAEAHALGIVHRDLKPANLFVTLGDDGVPRVKVLDFGISKVHDVNDTAPEIDPLAITAPSSEAMRAADDASRAQLDMRAPSILTETHAVMGSPRYMAPEQHASARDVDARCDVWALGVVLYELLSGKRPFEAQSLGDLRAAIRDRRPSPLRAAGVPEGLSLAIETSLAKDSSDRYQSVEALAEAIAPYGSAAAPALLARIARFSQRAGSDFERDAETTGPFLSPTLRSESGRRKLRALAMRRAAERRKIVTLALSALAVLVAVAAFFTMKS